MSHFELHVHSICYDQRKDTSFPIEKKLLILIGDVSEKFILAYRAYIFFCHKACVTSIFYQNLFNARCIIRHSLL